MQIETKGPDTETEFKESEITIKFESLDEIRSLWHRHSISSQFVEAKTSPNIVPFPSGESTISYEFWKKVNDLLIAYGDRSTC